MENLFLLCVCKIYILFVGYFVMKKLRAQTSTSLKPNIYKYYFVKIYLNEEC